MFAAPQVKTKRFLAFATPLVSLILTAFAIVGAASSAARSQEQSTTGCSLQWRVVTSPNHGTIDNYMYSVAAISPADVWIAGTDRSGSQSRTLTFRWNGRLWLEPFSPSPSFAQNYFFSLAALESNNVWALGAYGDTSNASLMLSRWNGNQWTINASAVAPVSISRIHGDLAAISSNDVWAASYQMSGGMARNLTLHWNGSNWNTVVSPNASSSDNFLAGIAAVAANDVWGVGGYRDGDVLRTLTMRWNGQEWSIIPSPNPGAGDNFLNSISATSADNVWAVGYYLDSTNISRTLALRWDGTQWNVTPGENPRVVGSFNDVVALAPNDVWAVGRQLTSDNQTVTLIEHWDGSQWTIVASPNAATSFNDLRAISAISANDIWTTGSYRQGTAASRSLLLRYNDPCKLTPTSTASAVASPTAPPTVTVPPSATAWQTDTPTPTGTSTYTHSPVPTATPVITNTRSASHTATATATATAAVATTTRTPTANTPTPCPVTFSDVQPSDYFYEAVRYLYCRGVISGYTDSTFRPYNNTTRGQLTKIVVLAEGWIISTPATPTFTDVPETHPFYAFVETAYVREIISGYSDGTFRPYNNVTRGQLCKIVVLARGWPLVNPSTPRFADVPATDPFFLEIETAYDRDIISGYSDNTFRPYNNATRGQISKLVYEAVTEP
jgi:hypothetical protein